MNAMSPDGFGAGTEVPEPDEDFSELTAEALELEILLRAHAAELPLSDPTIDLLLGRASATLQAEVTADESRRRVRDLVRRRTALRNRDVAQLLRSGRQHARIAPQTAAHELSVSTDALQRIEEGSISMLRNVDPATVAMYLHRIAVPPTPVIRAALRPASGPAWGYTPGDHGETRPQFDAAEAGVTLDPSDRDWIVGFMQTWTAQVSGGGASPT